jgi:hypothetical protein
MARFAYDFRCDQGHVHERYVDPTERTTPCPTCNRTADRMIPAPRAKLEGFSGDFPTAADAWANNRESHMRKERKVMANHKEYLNGQPVYD